MRFRNNVIDKKVAEAIKDAERLLTFGSTMLAEVHNKNDWKYESGNGFGIVIELMLAREPVNVFTYRPFNPWTSAIGYFDGKAIHINSRKLPRMSHVDIVSNLLHEFSHYCGFSHGTGPTRNYKTKEKCLCSVPYFISENTGRWL